MDASCTALGSFEPIIERCMRARSEPVRAFSTKDEAVRFAGRQLGGNYAVYHKDRKIWPIP